MWLVTVMRYDLGYCDDETCWLDPIDNPFDRESATDVLGMNCHLTDVSAKDDG